MHSVVEVHMCKAQCSCCLSVSIAGCRCSCQRLRV